MLIYTPRTKTETLGITYGSSMTKCFSQQYASLSAANFFWSMRWRGNVFSPFSSSCPFSLVIVIGELFVVGVVWCATAMVAWRQTWGRNRGAIFFSMFSVWTIQLCRWEDTQKDFLCFLRRSHQKCWTRFWYVSTVSGPNRNSTAFLGIHRVKYDYFETYKAT